MARDALIFCAGMFLTCAFAMAAKGYGWLVLLDCAIAGAYLFASSRMSRT